MLVCLSRVLVAGSANNWWERDPNINNSNNFMNVNTSGNPNNNNNANNTNGVCLGFCNKFSYRKLARPSNRSDESSAFYRRSDKPSVMLQVGHCGKFA